MTNSNTVSRQPAPALKDAVVFAAWICAFVGASFTALCAMARLSSPLLFFTALSVALYCIDPIRARLR